MAEGHGPREGGEGGGLRQDKGEKADSWQGMGKRMRSRSKPCGTGDRGLEGGGDGEDIRRESWRGGRGEWGRQRRQEKRRSSGQRASGLGESWATGTQHRRRPGGRSCRTRRTGDRCCAKREAWGERGAPRAGAAGRLGDPNPRSRGRGGAGEGSGEARVTYWGPSARRRWGSPPADEGRGSPGRPGGPGSSRTGQWSKPWLREPRSGTHLTSPHPAPRQPTASTAEPALL